MSDTQQNIDPTDALNDVYIQAIRRCANLKDPQQIQHAREDAKKKIEQIRKQQEQQQVKVDEPTEDS